MFRAATKFLVIAAVGAVVLDADAQDRPTHAFDRAWLEARAQSLAEKPHAVKEIASDAPLASLEYDDYRRIRFERGASIWRGEGRTFTVDLFHPGFLFRVPVNINLVVAGISRRVLYTNEIFTYEDRIREVKEIAAPGYSGFRVAAPINRADIQDEFLVFQGASYFRAVGRNEGYGLSARGLAIATAKPQGEEFPVFTDFWIERPPQDAESIVIHALLQTQSATGAYTFTATPGESTVIDVLATLFPRTDLTAVGLAPLTSMFLFDGTNQVRFDDFRPAVHDSNGLAVRLANGERVWRPLANPASLQVSAFVAESPVGFGLAQRKRTFSDYEDSEARYETRPSAWIAPADDWGRGHVELVEIPSDNEIHDNIVAFWQPDGVLEAGKRHDFAYRLTWGDRVPGSEEDSGRVVDTRIGAAAIGSDHRKFVIDFDGSPSADDLVVNATSSVGTVMRAVGHVVDATGNFRAFFDFDPEGEDLAELRVTIDADGQRWGETWLYRWTR